MKDRNEGVFGKLGVYDPGSFWVAEVVLVVCLWNILAGGRPAKSAEAAPAADFSRTIAVEPFEEEGCSTIENPSSPAVSLLEKGSKAKFLCYVSDGNGNAVPADISWKYLFGGDETMGSFGVSSERRRDGKSVVTVEATSDYASNILLLYSHEGCQLVANVFVSASSPKKRQRLEAEAEGLW